jgi:hypothetical protein
LKPKLGSAVFKNEVCATKKTLCFTGTKINWLTLFKEINIVYADNHTKHHKCKLQDLWILGAGGIYRYNMALKG